MDDRSAEEKRIEQEVFAIISETFKRTYQESDQQQIEIILERVIKKYNYTKRKLKIRAIKTFNNQSMFITDWIEYN